ncbi:MAG: rhomboid family intramembrane serine protease [Marinilabiliales bacterium]|nr:MAG: rhomboid family intramembrane serine protease [Marinilabiliales bacterium]
MSISIIIIAITVIISVLAFNKLELFDKLKFNPYLIKEHKQWWRFLSHALLHSDWMHLLINMYVLYSFSSIVEDTYFNLFSYRGLLYFVLLYVGGVLFSTVFDYSKQKSNPYYNAVGASGAVSAVVFSSILIFPGGSIFLFPIPFPIPSWVFGILYIVYSAYMGKKANDNIGHNAHLWGAIYGIVFTAVTIPNLVSGLLQRIF